MRKLISGLWRPELENSFAHIVKLHKAENPLAPILLLTPHLLLHRHLLRILAKKGIAAIYAYTLEELASEIQPTVCSVPLRPLPRYFAEFILQDIVKEKVVAESYFAKVAVYSGFPLALHRTIGDLKKAGISPQRFEQATSRFSQSKYEEFGEIYRQYQKRLDEAQLYEPEDSLRICSSLTAGCSWLEKFKCMVVYGFYRLSYVEKQFLQALFAKRDVTVFVPFHRSPVYRPVENCIRWLKTQGFEWTHFNPRSKGNDLDKLKNALFCPQASSSSACDKSVKIISAGDEHKEVESVAQVVFQEAGMGKRLGTMSVLLRNPEYYSYSLQNTLEARGIAHYVPGQTLADTDEARLLASAFDLFRSDFSQEAVARLTNSPALMTEEILPPDLRAGFLPPEWSWLSSHLRIFQGASQWLCALDLFLAQGLDSFLARRPLSSKIQQTGKRDYWIKIVRAFRQFLFFWQDAYERLRETDAEFFNVFFQLFEQICRNSPVKTAIGEVLASLQQISRTDFSADIERYWRIISEALNERWEKGKFREGVTLASIEQAQGVTFSLVVMPGMTEREFPSVSRQDPLLLDHERKDINKSLAELGFTCRLELCREAATLEKLSFHLAVSAAGDRLALTFPRKDALSAKEKLPSSFLLKTVQSITGSPCELSELDNCEFLERLPQNFFFRDGSCDVWPLIDELRLAKKGGGHIFAKHYPIYARATENQQARQQSPTFTGYEGVLCSPKSIQIVEQHLRDREISAKMLEIYANCPFRYFLENILAVGTWSNSLIMPSIPAYQRKKILENVLSRFLQGKSEETECENFLPRILQEVYLESSAKIFYPEMVWEAEQEKMLENLKYCIGRIKGKSGLTPAYFQFAYQNVGTGEFRFSDKIDQIDLDPGEKRLEGVRYRVGKKVKFLHDDNFHGGEMLGPAIDMMALCERFPDYYVDRVRYKYFQEDGSFEEVGFSRENWKTKQETLSRICGKIHYGIENGLFFAAPTSQKCRFCPYTEPCGSLRDATFAYKKDDPRITFFNELKGL